jgi:hypothetical protein
MRRTLLSLFAIVLAGCVAEKFQDPRFVVTYYDRNHDGIVDLEFHRLPGGADTNWALIDTKCSGHYDRKIRLGVARFESPVYIPVPRHVPITTGKLPIWIPDHT